MSWRAVTEEDVLMTLTEAERAAVDEVATGDQDSPIAAVIASTVAEIRGRIAAHPANKLDTGETLPATCIHQTLAIIRYRLLSRLPMQSLLTEGRKAEWDEANRFFRDVAKGEVSIEIPGDGTETRATPMVDVVASQSRIANRKTMAGL